MTARPWIEATAWLAAHGFVAKTKLPTPPTGWRTAMSADHRYCILRRPEDPREHPFVFADVQGLARHLHRRRGAAAIQLQDAALEFLDGRKEGVSVFTHQEGMQRRFIGWAYLDGKGFRVLQAALDRQQPQLGRRPTLGRPAQHQPGKAA